jgi:pimeloyl-ACP methyl ester carboxylesterase
MLLARLGRPDLADADPEGAIGTLEALDPSWRGLPDAPLLMADLSYRAAFRGEPGRALGFLRDAAVLASLALDDPRTSEPDRAIDLHNEALAELVRQAQADPRPWHVVLGEEGVALAGASRFTDPAGFFKLQVAPDVCVTGLYHRYATDGVGVPLVAHRLVDAERTGEVQDRYFPRELRVPTTALVRSAGRFADGSWRSAAPVLWLLDPYQQSAAEFAGRSVPLASDRSTPLAMQVADGHLPMLEITGLLRADFRREGVQAGLYMIQPFELGKIPVVFVHGLVSSPRAFAQSINELRNDPSVSAHYQFWVFLYPSGEPIPRSSSQLRAALRKAREDFDPGHADPALDRMVLIGHSMGGILSKAMVQDTTDYGLWNASIARHYDDLVASPELKESLRECLVFEPVPSVRRVVFIASPHRGSKLANDLIGRLGIRLYRPPPEMVAHLEELEELNGADVLPKELRPRTLNAIGNLRTDSPMLRVLARTPIRAGVPFHSIIPEVGGALPTDTVVAYSSAHLDGATSELTFAGTHFDQDRPTVTDELRRILREHLVAEGVHAVR